MTVADLIDKITEVRNTQKDLHNLSESLTESQNDTIENANDLLSDYVKMLCCMKVVESR